MKLLFPVTYSLSPYIIFYFDLSYIHALVFKETSSCSCTSAICHIRKPPYKQSFKILF